MKITKSQLRSLIKEEYVKGLLEAKGYHPSERQVKTLVESLDEGIFDSISKMFKTGDKNVDNRNLEAETKTQMQLKKEIEDLRISSKDKLKKHGFVGDENDAAVLGVELFNAALQEIMSSGSATPRSGKILKFPRRVGGLGKFRAA